MLLFTAYKILEFKTGFSCFKSLPTNNKTSASSTPLILEFIIYSDLKSGLNYKLPDPLTSKFSEPKLFK